MTKLKKEDLVKRLKVYTVGHSTRTLKELIKILAQYKVKVVIDVRRFPKSRKFPYFNKENIQEKLVEHGIEYVHLPELGGFREGGYKSFTQTDEFKNGLKKLLTLISDNTAVIMCTEKFFWRCHRKFIADELVKLGYKVIHILNSKTYEHKPKSLTE